MSDTNLQALRAQQPHSLLIPRTSAAAMHVPVQIRSTTREDVYVPKQQQFGFDSQVYLQYYPPNIFTPTALTSTAIQQGGTKIAQFQLRSADLYVTDCYLELETTYPTNNGSNYAAIMPGPLWIDRCEWSFNAGTPFQYLFGDMIFRNLLMSVTAEKLYQYALSSGRWINPPNAPGLNGPNNSYAPANNFTPVVTTATVSSTTVVTGITSITPNFNSGSMIPANSALFPYQPANGTTGYPSVAGNFLQIRIPLVGWFGQMAGLWAFQWIDTATLYLDVFGAGRPIYNTAQSGSAPYYASINTLSACNLLFRAISFPGDSRAEGMIEGANKNRKGYHFMYIDYLRYLSSGPSSTPSQGSTFDIVLDFTVGRHTAWLILMVRDKADFATTNSTGFLIGLDFQNSAGTALDIPDPTDTGTGYAKQSKNFYQGQRTVFGDRASGLPAIDILNPNGDKLFSNGGSILVDHWQSLFPNRLMPNNPWRMGVVGGSTTFTLATNEVPFFFCNPVSALQGSYDGSIEFVVNCRLRIYFGANALSSTYATNYDVYAAQWRCLHISRGSSGPGIDVEPDPNHIPGDV